MMPAAIIPDVGGPPKNAYLLLKEWAKWKEDLIHNDCMNHMKKTQCWIVITIMTLQVTRVGLLKRQSGKKMTVNLMMSKPSVVACLDMFLHNHATHSCLSQSNVCADNDKVYFF